MTCALKLCCSDFKKLPCIVFVSHKHKRLSWPLTIHAGGGVVNCQLAKRFSLIIICANNANNMRNTQNTHELREQSCVTCETCETCETREQCKQHMKHMTIFSLVFQQKIFKKNYL